MEHPAQQDYERRLIQRIGDGEHEAFYELIRPYERRVYAAALALLRNDADAEDCAQEAVLKAFKNIRQFRSEAKFSTWLIQIAVNDARMRRRKQRADLIEPIEKDQGQEGTYAPREFADYISLPCSGRPDSRQSHRRNMSKHFQSSLLSDYRQYSFTTCCTTWNWFCDRIRFAGWSS